MSSDIKKQHYFCVVNFTQESATTMRQITDVFIIYFGKEQQNRRSTYPKCSGEAVLQVGGDAHEQRLAAGDHGHAGGQVPHHVVGGHAHAGLLRVQGEVLPDDLLAGGHGDLDGAVDHGVHQLLDSSLHRLPHALLQLRVGLEQRDLKGKRGRNIRIERRKERRCKSFSGPRILTLALILMCGARPAKAYTLISW